MRISDWSSDVCSSDLAKAARVDQGRGQPRREWIVKVNRFQQLAQAFVRIPPILIGDVMAMKGGQQFRQSGGDGIDQVRPNMVGFVSVREIGNDVDHRSECLKSLLRYVQGAVWEGGGAK